MTVKARPLVCAAHELGLPAYTGAGVGVCASNIIPCRKLHSRRGSPDAYVVLSIAIVGGLMMAVGLEVSAGLTSPTVCARRSDTPRSM